jgi:dienelactone hydrolase
MLRSMRCWTYGGIVCAFAVAATAAPATPAFRTRLFTFVDRTRSIALPDGKRVPRSLETVVRYPASGGSHPLIVFAHGFALMPATYSGLLSAWARAGYVVAAPAFPLEKADATGGPSQSDLVNEPGDVRLVISRLLNLNARSGGVLDAKIDSSRIAVAGHSDGAVTALAVAYDRRFRDPRVRAAIVLSGAELPGMGSFPPRGPPLLAVQGTADPVNAAATTAAYFERAHRPKFLLWLLGASHRPPYTTEQPQLGIVEDATIAFLDHYLKGRPLGAFRDAARRPGITRLTAEP